MKSYGSFRVYFNRHGAEPLMWCISPIDGSWEIAVRLVRISAPCATHYAKRATDDHEDGKPSAWIEVAGMLTIDPDGKAFVETEDDEPE